jgi:hypothetical protein
VSGQHEDARSRHFLPQPGRCRVHS